ncbi:MAG: 3'(2'),5'-bisphosphate nucleotidase CysQ [Pseudomonadota bacterium]
MIKPPLAACGKEDTLHGLIRSNLGDLQADHELLSTAVDEAGAIARRYFRADPKSWEKEPGQIVTEADIAIDRSLHTLITTERPNDGWLSEERRDDGSRSQCQRVWVVDPIDGTRSFANGVAEFTISIALMMDGQPVLASVSNPITMEHFEATLGGGAWLNGTRITPSKLPVIVGYSLLASWTEMKKRRWQELMPEASFTTIGSLAYKLALVAAGRYSGLVSLRSCSDWDIAAAVLILKEAGAVISDGRGQSIQLNQSTLRHAGLVAAGAEPLYTALINRLETIRSSK